MPTVGRKTNSVGFPAKTKNPAPTSSWDGRTPRQELAANHLTFLYCSNPLPPHDLH